MDKTETRRFKIFIHIQKTGGITLQRLLRSKWNPLPTRILKSVKRRFDNHPKLSHFENFKMDDHFYIGHNCFGIHRFLPQPFEYITILREPVSRIISLYTYSKNNPTAYYHKYAKEKSLEEFALNTPLMELDNGQTRFIAGDEKDIFINRTPINRIDHSLLDKALYNINNYFSFVGITECFDESVLMMTKIFDWTSAYHLKLNEGRKPTIREEIPDSLKEKIRERNWVDVKLYDCVKKNFNHRLQIMEINPNDVDTFRANNLLYNKLLLPPYRLYDRAKAMMSGNPFRP